MLSCMTIVAGEAVLGASKYQAWSIHVILIGFLLGISAIPLADAAPREVRSFIARYGSVAVCLFSCVEYTFIKLDTATLHSEMSIPAIGVHAWNCNPFLVEPPTQGPTGPVFV